MYVEAYAAGVATQAERRASTSGALCRAARQLFAQNGFEAASVDGIAAAAGVTRGAFYHHFSHKEALFEAVFEDVESELVTAVRRAAAPHADPLEQLRAGGEAFIEMASDPRFSRIALVDAPAVLGPDRYRQIEEAHFLGLTGSSLARLRPERTPAENALAARALMAALCALAIHAAAHPTDLPVAQCVVRDLLRG